jgi:hypothetical protein
MMAVLLFPVSQSFPQLCSWPILLFLLTTFNQNQTVITQQTKMEPGSFFTGECEQSQWWPCLTLTSLTLCFLRSADSQIETIDAVWHAIDPEQRTGLLYSLSTLRYPADRW